MKANAVSSTGAGLNWGVLHRLVGSEGHAGARGGRYKRRETCGHVCEGAPGVHRSRALLQPRIECDAEQCFCEISRCASVHFHGKLVRGAARRVRVA